jgi:alcohol dehydrogenase
LHRDSLSPTGSLTTVKAVLFEQFAGPLQVCEVPDPTPPVEGVVVRVKANGICRSDWHGWMGHDPDIRLPHVPGHELAGVVEAVGPGVRHWRAGDRVTVPFVVGCGRCPACRSGDPQVCDDQFQPGFTAWGSFAEFVALPRADLNLVRLPEELGFVAAASLGCRFTTAFRAVVHQGRVAPGEWVAVHGCGGVGLAAVMIAVAAGAQVVAVDVQAEALGLARTLGATHGLNARETPDVPAAIQDLTGGGAHLSLDALGSRATCLNSIAGLRKRGRHVQVGLLLAEDHNPPLPMHQVIARELELRGSHGMAAHAFPAILELVRSRRLDPSILVRRTVSLAESIPELAGMGSFRGPGMTVIDRF